MASVYERDGEWLAVPRPLPLARVVRGALLNALAYTNGSFHDAARWLAISERQFHYACRRHGIPTAHGVAGRRGRVRAWRVVRAR